VVRNYWEAAFKKVPDLSFELKEITAIVGSIAVTISQFLKKWQLR